MSRQVRIEEIEDSDPEDVDISTLDLPDLPIASSTFQPGRHIVPPKPSNSTPSFPSRSTPAAAARNPTLLDNPASSIPAHSQTQYLPASEAQTYKSYQCLYPIYFDAARSRALGRKVSKPSAVANPLAREIADACASIGLKAVFEPGKTHPRDWSNPGRVKVLLKRDGTPLHPTLKNKFLLYKAIAEYLQDNPTTPETPLKLRIPNVPFDGKPALPPVVPRGWIMGSVLPLHSPALSGGGVTEDIFKEMMEGMGMGGMGGMGSGGGGGGGSVPGAIEAKKEKKDKKKKK